MKKFYCFLFAAFLFSGCSFRQNEDAADSAKKPGASSQEIQTVLFNYGDIFINTFKQTKLSDQDVTLILQNLKKIMNVDKCMPNDYYEIIYSGTSWSEFTYFPQDTFYYSLKKSSCNAITCEKIQMRTSKQTVSDGGVIENSLWESMTAHNLKPDVIMEFADIFASKIDFLTDVRKGDTFKIIYETETVKKTDTVISSKILAGQYNLSGTTYTAILYEDLKGTESYFDEEAHSMRLIFLKAPLQFKRISSYFSKRRFHPILKYYRPHEGIDYAAPTGTPVSSIGDGKVVKAQRSGGYGKLIIIRHTNGYETYYGHLSRYAKGIRRGARVKQGQLIGYVGMTGLATGPHLDFRIKKNGKFFNFLKMKMPPSESLSGRDKEIFLQKKDSILPALDKIRIQPPATAQPEPANQ